MNWDDPVARAELIERVGPAKYNEMLAQHMRESVVETVNGYPIRPVTSARFGRIFMVGGLNRGHKTLEGARKLAEEAPPCP